MVLEAASRVARRSIGAGLALIALGLAPSASAAPAPDEARIERLRVDCRPWTRIRVTTRAATFDLYSPEFDSAGVLREKPQRRPALLTPRGEMSWTEPRRIPWAEVERIEGTRTRGTGSAFAQGALVGGMVGLTLTVLSVTATSEYTAYGAVGYLPAGLLLGGLVGAGLASRSSPWATVFP